MPFRARIKAAFTSSSSASDSTSPTSSKTSTPSSASSTTPKPEHLNSDTTALRLGKQLTRTLTKQPSAPAAIPSRGIGDPKIYQPGEAMPMPKYRAPPTKEHKKLLEGYSIDGPAATQDKKSPFGRLRPTSRSLSTGSAKSGISPGTSRAGSYSKASGAAASEDVNGVNLIPGDGNAAAINESRSGKKPGWFRRRKSGMGNELGAGMTQVDESEVEGEESYSGQPSKNGSKRASENGSKRQSTELSRTTTTAPTSHQPLPVETAPVASAIIIAAHKNKDNILGDPKLDRTHPDIDWDRLSPPEGPRFMLDGLERYNTATTKQTV